MAGLTDGDEKKQTNKQTKKHLICTEVSLCGYWERPNKSVNTWHVKY